MAGFTSYIAFFTGNPPRGSPANFRRDIIAEPHGMIYILFMLWHNKLTTVYATQLLKHGKTPNFTKITVSINVYHTVQLLGISQGKCRKFTRYFAMNVKRC